MYSKEHIKYLKKLKKESFLVKLMQIGILILFLCVWEVSARFGFVDYFIVSSPSRIWNTLVTLYSNGQLWSNVWCTVLETVIGFLCGTFLGVFFSILIWWSDFTSKILDPYLVVLNALPKVALGPIIIVWLGSGVQSIIIMSLLMSVVISTINMLAAFKNTDKEKIFLMRSFGATKIQILKKLILPANIPNIISTLKINVGMSLVGVITGEFLVSSKGIGYLIVYGSQVFKLDLVMAGIIILLVIASILYFLVLGVTKRI